MTQKRKGKENVEQCRTGKDNRKLLRITVGNLTSTNLPSSLLPVHLIEITGEPNHEESMLVARGELPYKQDGVFVVPFRGYKRSLGTSYCVQPPKVYSGSFYVTF